jgi:hypothetical protein
METKIEQLQLLPTQVEAITPKVIADVILEIRREKAVWTQFFKENRDLTRTGGDAVIFPKKAAGIVVQENLTPLTPLNVSNIRYDAVTISIAKHGIGIGIAGESIRKAMRDVVADQIKEAGLVWSDLEDRLALQAMFPLDTKIASAAGAVAAAGPVVGIYTRTANVSQVVNTTIGTGSIVFTGAGTCSYWYVPSGVAVQLAGGGSSISAKDILLARAKMQANIVTPSVLLTAPENLVDIVYDPAARFVEQVAHTGAGIPYNFEIGRLWDMRVIVSGRVPKLAAVLIDPTYLGYKVIREELRLQRDEVTGMKQDALFYWGFGEFGYGVLTKDAYGVVLKTGTFSADSVLTVFYKSP